MTASMSAGMTAGLIARAPCTSLSPLRVAVLASGNGSNLQALIDAAGQTKGMADGTNAPKNKASSFVIAVVIVNKPGVGAIGRAEAAGIPVVVEPHHHHASRQAFDQALVHHLVAHEIELVVLAGFMRVLTPALLDHFQNLVLNVHPALCPAFPGLHAAKQALEHGVRITGCTVHLVDSGVDTGPILAQVAVPVLAADNEQRLQKRIQQQEHLLLPQVVAAIAEGREL